MNDIDKIRVLLPHWTEHSKSHEEEFAHWAGHIREAGRPEVAAALDEAAAALRQVAEHLGRALELAGGPAEGLAAHGRHHDHNHPHGHDHHHHDHHRHRHDH